MVDATEPVLKVKKSKSKDKQKTADVTKSASTVETKEERRARKEAKRQAKVMKADNEAEAGPSTIRTLPSSKSELEVAKLLEAEPLPEIPAVEGSSTQVDRAEIEKNTKKLKKREADAEDEGASSNKKKEKRKAKDEKTDVAEPVKEKKQKKEKKDKKGKDTKVPEEIEAAEGLEGVAEVKKKKKSKKVKDTEAGDVQDATVSVEDIAGDEDLSDQAKKAIIYVYQHSITHRKSAQEDTEVIWKFNKAKQIWLIKNIWDIEQIPEKYVDLVLGYLKTVQGMGRSGLIETAKKTVKAYEEAQEATTSATKTEEVNVDTTGDQDVEMTEAQNGGEVVDKPNRVRFDDTVTAAPGEQAADEEKVALSEEELKRLEGRKDRAKRVMQALGAR